MAKNGEVILLEETEEAREARERKRQDECWRVSRKIERHLSVLAATLEELGKAEDKASQGALAQVVRSQYLAARALVPVHRELGGSSYSTNVQLFSDLYSD